MELILIKTDYIEIVEDVMQYIDENISERLAIKDISNQFYISEFHFNRIFRAITGVTPKKYILDRKLSAALNMLKESSKSILDISIDLGFEYPEVFSRMFKQKFGIPPKEARLLKGDSKIELSERLIIIDRDFININGGISIKGSVVDLPDIWLAGGTVQVNEYDHDFKENLTSRADKVISDSNKLPGILMDKFYTVVSCSGKEDGEYTVFCGRKVKSNDDKEGKFLIEKGKYAVFNYYGDMYEIKDAFVDDLYRWLFFNKYSIRQIEIGMINEYSNDYPKDRKVIFYVPVE